jgi:hypothetical protein
VGIFYEIPKRRKTAEKLHKTSKMELYENKTAAGLGSIYGG